MTLIERLVAIAKDGVLTSSCEDDIREARSQLKAMQAENKLLRGVIGQALAHRYGDWTGILEASLSDQGKG